MNHPLTVTKPIMSALQTSLIRFSPLATVASMLSIALTFVGCDGGKAGNEGAKNSDSRKVVTQPLTKEQSDAASNALSSAAPDKKKSPDKVSLLLNWYPEAEHGGFYAAKVMGIYERFGLDVEIRAGGKTTVVPQELTLGRVQFGVANADDVLVARNSDVNLLALMAPIQNGPRCIMVRKDSGIKTFADLKNITLQIDSTRPYVPFLKSKGFLGENVQIVPYFGSVAQLVAGPGYGAQGYTFSEPFMARQQGVEVVELMMSEIGYNPYASLLVTVDSYQEKNDDICKRMVAASIEGWQKYLEDATATNAEILKNNKQGLEKDALAFGVEALKPLCYGQANDPKAIGAMTAERWKTLRDTLSELKMIDGSKVNYEKAFTTKYLPQ